MSEVRRKKKYQRKDSREHTPRASQPCYFFFYSSFLYNIRICLPSTMYNIYIYLRTDKTQMTVNQPSALLNKGCMVYGGSISLYIQGCITGNLWAVVNLQT